MDQLEELEKQKRSLPIFGYKEQLLQAILESPYCIITGDTGSGKSTQLPQYILDSPELTALLLSAGNYPAPESPFSSQLKIVITQPRRMAAISMANRICFERGCELGGLVGYTIRFDDRTSRETRMKYVTDGILVRECLGDPLLSQYNVVILDEAHERSLYTDILFTLVKQAVVSRQGGLKLIVTSATLNCEMFSRFFDDCPVIQMEGKCYHVDVKYGNCLSNKRVEESVKSAIRMHLHEGPGDIMVFLTGSEECEQAAKLCYQKLEALMRQGHQVPGMVIYSLYGSQASEEQARVFEKLDAHTRKLIFSTNIAETSLTIDNIGFVIDSGFVKQKCFNPRTGMDALIVVPISRVQAIQRAGRAGRTQPGKCYRMYTEQFYKNQMVEFTVPEIMRVNLSSTILTLKNMNIHDVVNFDYIESPDKNSILNGLKQLFLLSAIDENGQLTELGQELAKYPLEPSYSKSLLSSLIMGCEDMMTDLVSLLSTENIWIKVSRTNEEQMQRFEKVQSSFVDMNGDHLTLLRIYNKWVKSKYSNEFCRQNFLNIRAFRQAENIRVQLKQISDKLNLKKVMKYYESDPIYQLYCQSSKTSKYDHMKIFKLSLTSGFFFNCARQLSNSPSSYLLLPDGNIVNLDPSSIYSFKNQFPSHVVFTELAGSSAARGLMRQVMEVEGEWVKGYQERIRQVDVGRLAGIGERKNIGDRKNMAEVGVGVDLAGKGGTQQEMIEKRKMQAREQKIQESKMRYLVRKKIKL